MKTFRAETASEEVYGLGEGPLWDAPRERILWVDINAGHVHTGVLHEGRVLPRERIDFPETVGAVVCSAAGELLVAGARHLWTVALDGTKTRGMQLIDDEVASRLNDGACDPAGRFLVGSLPLDDRTDEESLVRLDGANTSTIIDDDLSLSNGLAWSPDGTVLYSTDTTPRLIWSRSYDPETGAIGERSEFLRIAGGGDPDGLCVDAEGNLWISIWGAGEVRCFSPSGEQLATVTVDAPNSSSVAFIGPDLDTLLITSAHEQMTSAQNAAYPDAGRLFTAHVEVRGTPVPAWSGKV